MTTVIGAMLPRLDPFPGLTRRAYGRDNRRAALDQYLQTKTAWTNLGLANSRLVRDPRHK